MPLDRIIQGVRPMEQNRNQHSPVDSSYSQVFVALSKNAAEIVNKLLKVQQDVTKRGEENSREWNPGMN